MSTEPVDDDSEASGTVTIEFDPSEAAPMHHIIEDTIVDAFSQVCTKDIEEMDPLFEDIDLVSAAQVVCSNSSTVVTANVRGYRLSVSRSAVQVEPVTEGPA